ncbi:shikimate dehydrogenase [Helicobacter muridarum]|uniref:shikimate dehydrogenase (NADP(+)) n=1 Tax=Helicobacter muridarum TaxID=216 RepID=A0A377PU29_9HELI|nr:shikimate dehydrogenase [Helicobacter muridarum]TLE01131.1 shikimate dehydrogenase [Helicobacter muridarum]STQ85999.1 shikimate 5-dehydrogenase [Helicobacter muridarum]
MLHVGIKNFYHNTRLFAVLGNPISHSLSPLIHNYAINALMDSKMYKYIQGIQNSQTFYTRFCLPLELNSNALYDFILQSDLLGVNVTVPFKEIAFECVNEVVGIASDIKAVNTIVKRDNSLIGYNTDAEGFFACIESYQPKNVLILGAGGSAKSIAIMLDYHKIPFCVANRSIEKLAFFEKFAKTISLEALTNESLVTPPKYDIVVNATSSSINNELPMSSEALRNLLSNCKLAFDLMYSKNELTEFCKVANECKVRFLDGKNMLVYQAAIAFMYFHLEKEIDSSERDILFREIVASMNYAIGI